jgi:hypothetical protein
LSVDSQPAAETATLVKLTLTFPASLSFPLHTFLKHFTSFSLSTYWERIRFRQTLTTALLFPYCPVPLSYWHPTEIPVAQSSFDFDARKELIREHGIAALTACAPILQNLVL